MKVLRPFTLALVGFLTACGGGGGGGDDVDACEQYCAFACSKSVNCGFFPANERLMCESSCVTETERLGRSEESCRDVQREVQIASCDEYAVVLGFRRESPQQDLKADDFGVVFGQEFAK